ncbi:MAG: hypothetical protein F6J93_09080 [Oscillatoria sp. SIO1A7]|nr:hypothetical protein [Oscillatoria sp. SIO1A7]
MSLIGVKKPQNQHPSAAARKSKVKSLKVIMPLYSGSLTRSGALDYFCHAALGVSPV